MQLNHKIHVLGKKEDLSSERLPGKIVIVLDVLFATSTIVTVLANGAKSVIPVPDETAARAEAARHPPGTFVLAGELLADTISGFAPPAPLALVAHGIAGKQVIYSTTNGTVALNESRGADAVYVAALLNGAAIVRRVLERHADSTILIVCSGSMGNFNLEDGYGAGYLVELLTRSLGARADVSDAARAVRALYRSGEPLAMLSDCRVGRSMLARGLADEVEHACRLSQFDLVARLIDGRVEAD